VAETILTMKNFSETFYTLDDYNHNEHRKRH